MEDHITNWEVKENNKRLRKILFISGLFIASALYWGFQKRGERIENDINWNKTYNTSLRVRDQAAGEDGILSIQESSQLIKDLGLPAGISNNEEIYFKRPLNDSFIDSLVGSGAEYTLVVAVNREMTNYQNEHFTRSIGLIHRETLLGYLEEHAKND